MKKLILLFLLFSLSIFSATARVLSVRATLNGANVVPANATTATGTLKGTFNDVTGVLNFTVAHNIPTPAGEYAYNFYYLGAAGTNGTFHASFDADANPLTLTHLTVLIFRMY